MPLLTSPQRDLGHTAIIDINPRRSVELKEAVKREAKARRAIGYVFPEARRYSERSTVERVNARLKDEFGAMFGWEGASCSESSR